MISRFEQFTFAISGIYRSIQRIQREEMIKYGCKGSYAQYIVVMNRFDEGITASQLSEICDKDKAAISRAVRELESSGLIERNCAKGRENLYRAKLTLTEKGKSAAVFVSERAKIAVEMAGKGLEDEDRKVFYSTLELIAGNLQNIISKGMPED